MFFHLTGVLKAYPIWLIVACVGVAVLSYCLGCFNGSVVVSRYILRNDIRNHGSGNAGLTNFYRTFGGPLTVVVILSDVVKAVIAILFSMWIFGMMSPELVPFSKYWAGIFCLLGHMFPCTFQFRGGKGILSGGTIAIMIDWRLALVVWGGFILLTLLTRYVSLGSCWAAASFPFATGFIYRDPLLTGLAIFIGLLVLWKHRGNIKRLVTGTESKFTLHKKAAEPAAEPVKEPEPDENPENDSQADEPSIDEAAAARSEQKEEEQA